MKLVVIESAGKIKHLSEILGKDYVILPTIGHIRKINDSGAYRIGIDCKNNFKVDYVYDSSKRENIKKIKETAKNAEKIFICSDADREGHGIAEEVQEILKPYAKKVVRTTFTEITTKAVTEAIKNPTGFDTNMAKAAESRAILDKLVGYRTSTLVLSKIGAPSAGRVQSALLYILAEKEEAIQKFKSTKYFDVFLDFKKGPANLTAKLCQIGTKKVERITEKSVVDDVLANCKEGNYTIEKITEKEKSVEPKPPMTTSSMQQLASNLYGWAPARTQKSAQELYEQGKITYIRTDLSVFSQEFLDIAKPYIEKTYGKEFYRGLHVPADKNKDAQGAHEGIRMTDVEYTPAKASKDLTGDNLKLYKMIYNYALAALFVPAKVKDTDILIKNNDYHFKVSGRQIVYASFLDLTNDLETDKALPAFKVGDKVNDKELYFEEKETQPPQRYSEAGLVKVMETSGIGRPSTYSTTIETLKKREYIRIEKKAVYVTEMGMKLNSLLKTNFEGIFNPEYTAKMEGNLDEISSGKTTELAFLNNFWKEFEPVVLKAARDINKDKPKPEDAGVNCPMCGKPLLWRVNKKNEKFIACSNFPKCKFTASTLESLQPKSKT